MRIGNEKYDYWYINRYNLLEKKLTGIFIVFYNQELTDTAIMVNLKKGSYEGLYKEWDRDDKYVSQECLYKRGFRKGICKNYVYYFSDDTHWVDKDSIMIQINKYECFKEYGNDVVGNEWIEYKTISYKQYEKETGVIKKKNLPIIKPKMISSDRDTLIIITPKIPKGVIFIDIVGNSGDFTSFGYYENGIQEVLAENTIVIEKGSIIQGFKTNGEKDLFIKTSTSCKIKSRFKESS